MKLAISLYAFCISTPTVWNFLDTVTHDSQNFPNLKDIFSSRLPLVLPPGESVSCSLIIFFTLLTSYLVSAVPSGTLGDKSPPRGTQMLLDTGL